MTKTMKKINDTICKATYSVFKLCGTRAFGFEKSNDVIGANFGYSDKNGIGKIIEFNKPLHFIIKEL